MTEASDTATDLDAGLAHHAAGRFADAEALYRCVLTREPDHPDALNLLGVILQDAGDLQQSIEVLSRAVQVDPAFPEAFTNLARALSAAGDPAGAKARSETAIDLDPELGEAHLQLARSLLALRDDQAAAAAAARAVDLAPDSADAQLFLGHALTRLKDHTAAAAAYRSADRLAPGRQETVLNLGIVLTELMQLDEAVTCCRRAIVLAPEDSCAHAALGRALLQAKNIPGSIEAVGRALELAPERLEVWKQQGDNFSLLGQFEAAAECYNHILAVDPDSSGTLSSLATIGKLADAKAAHGRLQAVLSDSSRPERERVVAGFALGALADEAGDYEAAFTTYAEANRLARGLSDLTGDGFDPVHFRKQIDRVRAAFTAATLEATRTWGDPSEVPVFIVGMPRSGTSLVEQILASHPQVYGAGERKDTFDIIHQLEAGTQSLAPMTWDPVMLRRGASGHLARLREVGRSCARIINKLPDNILLLGHIAMLFPNARVIFCRRDLRDVCLSCFFQLFGDGIGWAFDLADCAARACEIERLTAHWRAVLPLRMLEVDYETLVGDLEGQSRRLIDFLGLDWDDACLSFHATERAVHTASFRQVRQPLYSSSVGRWRHYLPFIQPLLDGLIGLVPIDGAEILKPKILAVAALHQQAGRIAAAETAYGLVIAHDPDNIDALYGLGCLAVRDGNFPQAVSLLWRAAEGRPGDGQLLTELSRACRAAGDLRASADAAGRAIALNFADGLAYVLLGSACLELDDTVGARKALDRAVELDIDSADAWFYLGMACMRQRDFPPAAAALREAVRLKPDDPECLTKLGWVLRELDQPDEALPYLHRALGLAPEDGRIHLALVMALWRAQDVAAAVVACNTALQVAPDLADLWLYNGHCNAALGQFAEATDNYRYELGLDPALEEARLGLATVANQPDGLLDVARLRAVLEDPGKEERERTAAGYTLGKLYDRAGDFDAAFAAITAANRLVRTSNVAAGLGFDPALFDRMVSTTATLFSAENLRVVTGRGDPSDLPVFVVGMPRSGTTLVEQIVSSHPNVFGAGELPDLLQIVQRLDGGLIHRPPIAWDRAVVAHEAAKHLERLRDLGGQAKRVIDKMPDNFRYLGHIAVLFPNARIIVCRRDLRDVCLSCYSQPFGHSLSWTTDLSDLATRACAFDRLMAHWRAVLPLPLLEVQYEDLVQNLASGSRRLLDFLGLEWDPACLSFHETDRVVLTASQWQVRQPLYTSSVGRWRHYQKHLGPLFEGLKGRIPPDGSEEMVDLGVASLAGDDLQGGRILQAGPAVVGRA